MDKRSLASYLLAISMICLAAAIVYFTLELKKISAELPELISSINTTGEKVGPIMLEVKQFRKQLPALLTEIQHVRTQIPEILKEVARVREQIPPILAEAQKTRVLVPGILNEMAKTRALVPGVLNELAKTRESIPPLLARSERLVEKAKKTGKKASEGAVTGIFTGIINAPFAILSSVGKQIIGLTQEEVKLLSKQDLQQIQTLSLEILGSKNIGDSRTWHSDSTDHMSKISLKKIDNTGDEPCRTLHIQTWKGKNIEEDKLVETCHNEVGEWELQD